jgi:hypothetical protein
MGHLKAVNEMKARGYRPGGPIRKLVKDSAGPGIFGSTHCVIGADGWSKKPPGQRPTDWTPADSDTFEYIKIPKSVLDGMKDKPEGFNSDEHPVFVRYEKRYKEDAGEMIRALKPEQILRAMRNSVENVRRQSEPGFKAIYGHWNYIIMRPRVWTEAVIEKIKKQHDSAFGIDPDIPAGISNAVSGISSAISGAFSKPSLRPPPLRRVTLGPMTPSSFNSMKTFTDISDKIGGFFASLFDTKNTTKFGTRSSMWGGRFRI